MSNAKTFQEWAKGILPIVQAAANGEPIEIMKSDGWGAKAEHLGFNMYDTYRIKPKTIRIGEYDVPEPLRDRPINGESVYLVCTDRAFPVKLQWFPDEYSLYLLDSGLLHRERAGAALHWKALLSLTKVGV